MKILVILSIFFYHSVTYAETGVFSGGDDGEGGGSEGRGLR